MLPRTRKLTIIAQDPAVTDIDVVDKKKILTTQVEIPAEDLSVGPRGYRVHVVDYDTSTDTYYSPEKYDPFDENDCYVDPYEEFAKTASREEILANPGFHCQNVYAIVMRTLARFEFALGRRVSWGFGGHQIYVAPHAFADANAFYSENDQALAFGYFRIPGDERPVFTCLSHDVVAHETTHALLDGLRERYTAPSSPEQAGFHEGFADLVAILSVFSLKDVVRNILLGTGDGGETRLPIDNNRIATKDLTATTLKNSALFGLADEMGSKLSGIRGNALRKSADLPTLAEAKKKAYLGTEDYYEPHKCGELLVAAMLNVFLQVWLKRLEKYTKRRKFLDVLLVVEEGAESANQLLTIAIRALDYLPPTDIRFHDYLSALLTADSEIVPDDSKYEYRQKLRDSFAAYGVDHAPKADRDGYWKQESKRYVYDRTHFDSLMRDPNEIFRFIWDNRVLLGVEPAPDEDIPGKVYTNVQSVRPCMRIGPDGFTVRETVAEYVQMSTMTCGEWDKELTENLTDTIPPETEITLYGGGTLIFDEYGQLKYHIRNKIFNGESQQERIEYLWRYGYISNSAFTENIFSRMHLNRLLSSRFDRTEGFE